MITQHPQLYPHQTAWITALGQQFGRFQAVLGQAPTGMGKGVCLAYMAHKIADKGKRVIICVHRQEILLQMSEHLNSFDVNHNLICAQQVKQIALLQAAKAGRLLSGGASVTLASLPTLTQRHRLPATDYLFVDEAHHSCAKTWERTIDAYKQAGTLILGVTATPERFDGKPLHGLFDVLQMGQSIESLIGAGYLAPFKIYQPPAQINRDNLPKIAGEFAAPDIIQRARKITGDAINEYRNYMDGEKCLVFCANIAEAKRIAQDFCDAGYRAASVDGQMKETERHRRIKDLGNHTLQLLTSCAVLSEGLDIPSVSGLIHLRPTCSRGRWMQDVGRTLRYEPGKISKILDHAGNTAALGNPLDIVDFAFDGNTSSYGDRDIHDVKDEKPRLTTCSACFMPFAIEKQACPYCGALRPSVAAKSYQAVPGELVAETRAHSPAILAAMELAEIAKQQFNGEFANALEDISKKYDMPPEWATDMARLGRWWETPIGQAHLLNTTKREI